MANQTATYNQTGIYIDGVGVSPSLFIAVLMGFVLAGIGIGFLYNKMKRMKRQKKVGVPDELPSLATIQPKMSALEKVPTMNIPNQNIKLGYDKQLDLDMRKVKTEMDNIESDVALMKINYENLKTKYGKLQKVKEMLSNGTQN